MAESNNKIMNPTKKINGCIILIILTDIFEILKFQYLNYEIENKIMYYCCYKYGYE